MNLAVKSITGNRLCKQYLTNFSVNVNDIKACRGGFFKFMIVLLMNVLTVPDILLNLTSKFIDTLSK